MCVCVCVCADIKRVLILDWDVHHGNGVQEVGCLGWASVHKRTHTHTRTTAALFVVSRHECTIVTVWVCVCVCVGVCVCVCVCARVYTQILYEDPNVLYISLHRDPKNFYPYTAGFIGEVGKGAGEGFNVNIPWPKGGVGDADYKVRVCVCMCRCVCEAALRQLTCCAPHRARRTGQLTGKLPHIAPGNDSIVCGKHVEFVTSWVINYMGSPVPRDT